MKYMVVDTETTGLEGCRYHTSLPCAVMDNGDEILQIGGLFLDEAFNPIRGFCFYCDILRAGVPEAAFNVHGISIREIRKDLPNIFIEEVVHTELPELFEDDLLFIGYNTDFDIKMLRQGLRNSPAEFGVFQPTASSIPRKGRWTLDVMKYMPKRRKLASYSEQLKIPRERFYETFSQSLPIAFNSERLVQESFTGPHNALYDVVETYLLFKEEVLDKRIFRGDRFGR